MPQATSVLFVCLGNICRSPLAEGVFRHLVEERGLTDRFAIDSAGTGAWHVGQRPDRRSAQVAAAHGIKLTGRGRQVRARDLERFDVVVAMDRENLRDLQELAGTSDGHGRLHLLREFDPEADQPDVPDPYFEGPSGFESVYRMVRRSCEHLLESLAPEDE
ncbi:MAG: low molecular weight phosphotyrosine protein phosphatase [Gemmatimonadetes bacterium]|nr:low molecular weight phosphotyrosine protein phosphatase [Gemmatimonadota bacterium]